MSVDAQTNGTINLSDFTQLSTFEEVLPEPVRVSIVEFREEVIGENAQGKPIVRRKPVARVAEINTYVPMKVFHRMIASQERMRNLQSIRAQVQQGEKMDAAQQGEMLNWMLEQVLAVWQLTEPEMTLEELQEGLSFQKIFGLFSTFFGGLLTSLGNKKL